MWALRPRKNCSLSTLAEKNSTCTRSMMTAMANTRQMAIGYIPKPPPFQCCARVSKNWFIVSSGRRKSRLARRNVGCAWPGCNRSPASGPRQRRKARPDVTQWTCFALNIESGMARGPEFPKVRHIAVSEGERSAAADAVIVAFEAAHPEPPEPAQGAPEGALPAAAAEPALRAGAQGAAPSATGTPPAPPAQPTTIARIVAVDVARARSEDETCRAPDGSAVVVDGRPTRCPNSAAGLEHAGGVAAWATHLGEAVLLDGIDQWYRLGTAAAGFCRSCELALVETLRESYGDHLEPFDPLAPQRAQPGSRSTPFAGAREALRFASAVEATKRAALRARDEARRARGVEMAVLGRVGTLTALALAVCRHLDGLVFDLPSLDPEEAVLPLLAVRAALGLRPAVGVLPAAATPEQVQLFAALALACDADLMLAPGASPAAEEALHEHRKFQEVVRERFRPSEPLLDLEVLVSPFAEHWGAAHLRTASACAAALGRAHLLLGARLDLAEPRAQILLLAGCAALPAEDAARARRHVESGGDAIVVGKCATCDDEGRLGPPVLPAR